MSVARRGPLTVFWRRLGTSLALLALLGQLGLGALVPRETQETVASLFPWIASICHSDGSANPGDAPGKHPHPLPGWMVCPFSLPSGLPGARVRHQRGHRPGVTYTPPNPEVLLP
jgi:hypothetical protein